MTPRAAIYVQQDGDHLHVDVSELERELRPFVAMALAEDCGLELPLAKAVSEHGEGPDPRYPYLHKLVNKAVRLWKTWWEWLVSRLLELLRGGKRHDPDVGGQIARALAVHEAGVIAAVTGHTVDPTITQILVHEGMLDPQYPTHAPVPHAFELGTQLDPVTPHPVPTTPVSPPPEPSSTARTGEVRTEGDRLVSPPPALSPAGQVRDSRAEEPPPPPPGRVLSPYEEAALSYVRSRAAVYMRRPVSSLHTAVSQVALESGAQLDRRTLTPAERAKMAAVIEQAILEGASVQTTARRLADAAQGTPLTNDMVRVAITELQFAHSFAAYAQLKAGIPEGQDPMVYKIVSPAACSSCRRIWGHPANPIRYKLSTVERGDNFGKPEKDWGPTIGPTHPRCTCPPIQLWNDLVHDAVQDVAEELRKVFGR